MSFIRGDLIPFKFSFIFSPKSHLRLGHSPSLDAFLRPRQDTSRQATPETMAVSTADKSKPYIPLAGLARDGWSKDGKASATCYCGAVQLAFPFEGDGLVNTFVCNCTDCRKITASMFASNFTIKNSHLEHVRGRDRLKTYSQSQTVCSGKAMTNYFCGTCGTLMYRVGERLPGVSILRIGTVDDFSLHETKLRPRQEHWVKDRVGWFAGVRGVEETFEGQG